MTGLWQTNRKRLHLEKKNPKFVVKTKGQSLLVIGMIVLHSASMLSARAKSAVVYTNLYSFTGGYNSASPVAGLVQGTDGNLYGTTYWGGTNGLGTVFKISTSGTQTSLYSFTDGNDGASPWAAPLVQGSDGSLYGTAVGGGTNGFGTVFQVSTNGVLTPIYSFTGGDDGSYPEAGLVQGRDGMLYGTAYDGGTNDLGTVFQISTNGALTPLYSFTGGDDGAHPQGVLVQGSDGNFYGTTFEGGDLSFNGGEGAGVVFKISTNGAFTTLHKFTGGNDGAYPYAGLIQCSDGNFYGTTAAGGSYGEGYIGHGTIFRISSTSMLTNLYSFSGGSDGNYPAAALLQGRDSNLYGTTGIGGTNNVGTVFQISTNGTFVSLHSFSAGIDGDDPDGSLIQCSDGSFYGTTFSGGVFTNQYG